MLTKRRYRWTGGHFTNTIWNQKFYNFIYQLHSWNNFDIWNFTNVILRSALKIYMSFFTYKNFSDQPWSYRFKTHTLNITSTLASKKAPNIYPKQPNIKLIMSPFLDCTSMHSMHCILQFWYGQDTAWSHIVRYLIFKLLFILNVSRCMIDIDTIEVLLHDERRCMRG